MFIDLLITDTIDSLFIYYIRPWNPLPRYYDIVYLRWPFIPYIELVYLLFTKIRRSYRGLQTIVDTIFWFVLFLYHGREVFKKITGSFF